MLHHTIIGAHFHAAPFYESLLKSFQRGESECAGQNGQRPVSYPLGIYEPLQKELLLLLFPQLPNHRSCQLSNKDLILGTKSVVTHNRLCPESQSPSQIKTLKVCAFTHTLLIPHGCTTRRYHHDAELGPEELTWR